MIIVPPEASLGHWQNLLETPHSMSLLPYPTSRWDRGGVELTLWHPPDICTAEAPVHFQRLHGLTSFLLIYGQEMVLYLWCLTLGVSLPISVHLPVVRQGHSLTTIKLYFCTHKGMSSESHMQQVLCSNEFENFGADHPRICTGAISSEVQQWLSSVQNTMEAMSLFGAEFQLVVLGILSK